MLKELFPTGEYKNEEITSALKWYFESKNYHLEKAIEIKPPLSLEKQKELRIAFSNYFVSLMAAIEVLLENSYRNNELFRAELYGALSGGSEKSGENNYKYLRELRNSIVHRGYDVCSAASVKENTLMLIAPPVIPDKSGKKEYTAFGQTILEIILKVENLIGNLIFKHIDENSLFKPTYTNAEKRSVIIGVIPKITHMPEWAKQLAVEAVEKIDFDELLDVERSKLEETLKYNVLLHNKA